MKFLKECPILIGIVTIAVILTVISFACQKQVYSDYAEETDPVKTPALALVLKGARDGVFPWSSVSDQGEVVSSEGELVVATGEDAGTEGDTTGQDVETAQGQQAGQDTTDDGPSWLYGDANEAVSDNDVSGNDSEEEVYEFTEVDDDYFSDALFIGDSRTVGLSEYCEPLDERATFYSKVSLTIFTAMNKDFVKTDDGKITVDEALQKNKFAKIYIMLGLNEIGTGDTEYFTTAYKEVLDRIVELQPDAIIYIQGIMHVTAEKANGDKNFNNEKINARNEALAQLADQKTIFYIDMNEAVDDEDGNLDSSLSFDGVHLKASSYERWHEFLLHNAIVR
ncbi:acylhydrolase [Butyrivibrio sp. CB08]|uniref:GDSL-type esterase/lipase family protein n=1 Tax=Butyrivibrio sp. CB08 TaxID=2364879 RepID=UPI000EA890EB|nr:GDSL-type esterase/lipase family protein [Butyrivibrio sp. CB08]RKM61961.1 acylhydrolase [Butyrivibrio sp. CB08]